MGDTVSTANSSEAEPEAEPILMGGTDDILFEVAAAFTAIAACEVGVHELMADDSSCDDDDTTTKKAKVESRRQKKKCVKSMKHARREIMKVVRQKREFNDSIARVKRHAELGQFNDAEKLLAKMGEEKRMKDREKEDSQKMGATVPVPAWIRVREDESLDDSTEVTFST